MKLRNWLLIAAVALATPASAQMERRDPHIGYAYPAGGQQGSTVEVLIGGQAIGGASLVHVTGEGVHAASVQFVKPLSNDQLKELRVYVTGLIKARQGTQAGKPRAKGTPEEDEEVTPDVPTLLQHPLLKRLPDMSLPELEHWATQFLNTYRRQLNPQLIEMAVVELVIDADAEPGDRELRIAGRQGVSNPLRFQVGTLPEVREHEPNDQTVFDKTPLELPAVLNGQIMPGDVDRFRFHAKADTPLLLRAQARSLMPYLADAVPGWFEAALTLYDATGKEVAFADHYRFEPDPVLTFKAPKDGEYEIEVR
ncbi:MAG: hypothetical protein RBU21_21380, partial [FCB group bacterium]|nr:hypothetical protein [FCB group bacterium]